MATLTKPNGILIEYSYEDRELLSQRVYKQGMAVLGTDTFTYHPNQLLKTAHGGLYNTDIDRSTLATDYDLANRVIREQCDIGAGLKTLSYQYAPDSLVSQFTYPGGTVVARTYNTHRLLNEVKIGGVTQASHTYDTADRPDVRTYVNGTDTNWDFDANNRVTKLNHATIGMAPTTFQEWDYRYTDADNPLVQDDITPGLTVHGEAYTYDGLHRVNDFKRGTVAANTVPAPTSFQTWTLSKVGDWDQWNDNGAVDTRTHNNIHALTARSVVANPQTYDQNFSQTDDGANYKFEYDANDMLQTVKNRATMAVVSEYRYDAFGRRVEKSVGAAVTRYYHVGQQVVEERDGADAITALYTYGDYIDGRLTMDRGGARHYYHENRMYSTYVMTDNTGAVAERYDYTGYGVVTTYNAAYGAAQTTSRLGNPYAFTGRELDDETLLYQYRVRTYDPVQGRFKQTDPIGLRGGANVFQYAAGYPTGNLDPSGQSIQPFRVIGPLDALATVKMSVSSVHELIRLASGLNPHSTWYQRYGAQLLTYYTDPMTLAMTDISKNFWAGVTTDAGNKFVFTCKCGWLDMGHFWASALAGYKTNAVESYAAGILVEEHQQYWPGGTWHESAYTAEDLVSDWKGAHLGQALQGGQLMQIMPLFRKLLIDCNAVQPDDPKVAEILQREAIQWSGRTLPPATDPFNRPVVEGLPANPTNITRNYRVINPQPTLGNAYKKLCVGCEGNDIDWTYQWINRKIW